MVLTVLFRRSIAGLIAAFALASAGEAAAQVADLESHLQFRWYRIELILFENSGDAAANEDMEARQALLDAMPLPRNARPLVEAVQSPAESAIGQRLAPDEPLPLVVSNLAPPIWFAGTCAAESWQPPEDGPTETAFDPCLPRNDVDLEAEFRDDPWAHLPSSPAALEPLDDMAQMPFDITETTDDEVDERQALLQALGEYEDGLLATSYHWQRQTPALASQLSRLRRQFSVLAAGSWHQPVPPRNQAQPLLLQLGTVDDNRRFQLEGWLSVTVGRFIHFGTHLQYHLGNDAIAVLSENRRMRLGEVHYLDHPAFGILALVQRLRPPEDLQRRIDELAD